MLSRAHAGQRGAAGAPRLATEVGLHVSHPARCLPQFRAGLVEPSTLTRRSCHDGGAANRPVRRVGLSPVAVQAAAVAAPEKPPEVVVPIEGVTALPVTKTVTCLRGICNERLKYEIEYGLKKGTSENAYLIKAPGGGVVLVDIPFKAFQEDFLRCLEGQVNPRDLTHVVITHLGPNRIPTLVATLRAALKDRAPGSPLSLVATNPAVQILEQSLKEDEKALLESVVVQVVKGSEDVIQINDNYKLQPLTSPTPRWPDAMCVLDPSSKVLFSSKLFSAHVAPGLVNDKAADVAFDYGAWETYSDHWRYFFDCMLAPVPKQALAALDKLPLSATPRSNLDKPTEFLGSIMKVWGTLVDEITRGAKVEGAKAPRQTLFVYALAPQHGPVVRASLNTLVQQYTKWAEAQVEAMSRSLVTVLYASAYGNTASLAQAISRGITKGGVAVNTLNLEQASLEEVEAAIKSSNGFVMGSPTLGGHMPTQVQLALGTILRNASARGLPCGVFGSFGWSGEAVDEMQAKLKDGGYSFAFKPIKVKFKPTAKDLATCEQSGRDLAVQVKRKLKTKERSSTANLAENTASGAQLAMGRVVGSLAVVTARDEDATSAMLASWISQASFDPPGITVSVKKDRGMEGMLVPGSSFALSLLPEGQDKPIMKVMTKPFAPGQDRLASLTTSDGELSGCPILKDSHASMECEVVSRMEAGDHYVVYGKVLGGQVTADGQLTAVHHRKVGNHY